jgi:hypothetical protein
MYGIKFFLQNKLFYSNEPVSQTETLNAVASNTETVKLRNIMQIFFLMQSNLFRNSRLGDQKLVAG